MSEATKAVFLSYASQDSEAAKKICDALRAAGVEVWFDQSELRGGDAWDAQIRKRIKECSLFVPVISANTNARAEGYFRLEWKLAVDRSHLMADDAAFLFPVVIGDITDATARVPDKFRDVQWTRLRLDETPGELALRVAKLLSREPGAASGEPRAEAGGGRGQQGRSPSWLRHAWVGVGLLFAVIYAVRPMWPPTRTKDARPAAKSPEAGALPSSAATRDLVAQARALLDDPLRVKVSYRAAEDLCARAVALDPQDASAWAVYADVASDLIFNYNDHSEQQKANARTRAERALRLAPDSLQAGLAMAHYETVMKDDRLLVAAEQRLRVLLVKAPADKRGLVLLGNALGLQGKVAAAMAAYDQCNRLPGGSAEALARKAWTLYHLGQPEAAVAAADASLAVAPNTHAYGAKLICLLLGLGDLPRMRAVIEAMPPDQLREDRVAFFAYQMWMLLREPEQAAEALGRIDHDFIQEGQLTMPTRFGLGDAQRLAGRPRAAAIEYESALATVDGRLKADPSNGDLAEWKTVLLARLGRSAEAQQWFQTTLELDSIKPDDWARMSPKTLVALGRLDDAISVLEARVHAGWLGSEFNWRVDPEFDALRALPRYQDLLKEADKKQRDQSEGAASLAPTVDAKSVAVLAFANLSDDKENEYFSDGISEELLTVLQKIPGLHVAARTSAFSFKGKNATAQEIGEKLGVANIVEGSVQKSGKRVKITARLSKAATGEELWSRSFGPMELSDVFATQSELAEAIVGELRGRLMGEAATSARVEIQAQVSAAEKGGTKNPAAHELYLQGKYFTSQSSRENFAHAIGLLRRAVELDPSFALGWAALSRALSLQGAYGVNDRELEELFAEARRAAEQALALEPNLPEGYAALMGVQLRYDLDWKGAAASANRALELAPTDATILGSAWQALIPVGQVDRAIALAQQALTLDPLNAETRGALGLAYLTTGRFRDAETVSRQMLATNPDATLTHINLAGALLLQGRVDEAALAIEGEPDELFRNCGLALVRWAQKRPVEADAALQAMIAHADVLSYQVAEVYGARHELDQAFAWLDRAYQNHDSGLANTRTDPFFTPLHADPRWPAFLKKIGLSDEQLK